MNRKLLCVKVIWAILFADFSQLKNLLMSQGQLFFGKVSFVVKYFFVMAPVPLRKVFDRFMHYCSFQVIFYFWFSGCQSVPQGCPLCLVVLIFWL